MSFRAIAFGLVVAVLSATLLLLYVRQLEVETSGGSPVRVLMATKPIEPGMNVTEDMIAVRTVPQAYVETRTIKETDKARILGLKVEIAIKPQQTIQWTDLAVTTDDRRYLSDLVQPGLRAVSIRPSADDQQFSLVRPGDRVDVVANLPDPEKEGQRVAVLVAQNLLVLAVGTDMGAETVGGGPVRPGERQGSVLTLSATIPQLQQLSLAGERGRLNVALKSRSGGADMLEGIADMPLRQIYNAPETRRPLLAPAPRGPISLTPQGGVL